MCHHHSHENLKSRSASLHLLAQNDKMTVTINRMLAGKSVASKGTFKCRSSYYSSQTLKEAKSDKTQYKILK
jgi:hypothetical protein